MTETKTSSPDVETLIAAALEHGVNSEPDHEAGDLQDYFRAGWTLLAPEQRKALLKHPRLKSAIEAATRKTLRVTERLLQENGVKIILDHFQEHGNDEGPETEITDLQDALRSCWDVLTSEQRTELLELETVQETYMNATMKPLFPEPRSSDGYLVSHHWGHIFVGKREETTRWIYDCAKEELVSAQVLNGSEWVDLDAVAMSDLLEDIHSNDAPGAPVEWYLGIFDTLPSWQEVEELFSDSPAKQDVPRG